MSFEMDVEVGDSSDTVRDSVSVAQTLWRVIWQHLAGVKTCIYPPT